MKKAKLSSRNTNNKLEILPRDLIIMDILPRLPVKSLLRFKTVCKTWCSAITTTNFRKSHLQFSSSSPKFLLFHVDDERKIFLLSYNESKKTVTNLVQPDIKFLTEQSYLCHLVGSWNGILCWYLEELDSFTLWNPATRHYRTFQRFNNVTDDVNYFSPFEFFGFGYVSSTDDYKIVVMYLSERHDDYGYWYVFSLKTGTWGRIKDLDGTYYSRSLADNRAVCINDTLYWPFGNQDTRVLVGIIGFNLVRERMNKVQKVPWLCNYSKVDQIFKMKGCLSLCCSKGRNLVSDVWLLKQRGGTKTWMKVFSIDCRLAPVIDFTENGKYLVQHSGQLKLIDPNEKDTDYLKSGIDCDDEIQRLANKYVESLISF
ncbi:F-box/kelch-repeat protein At3g23880-like [Silene latifolia]|uniref:F-box/kelch-repeat protein At3g23880-like n=1 Tax=Silene latifolia TaxID=37657 RepID=UPI003D7777EA